MSDISEHLNSERLEAPLDLGAPGRIRAPATAALQERISHHQSNIEAPGLVALIESDRDAARRKFSAAMNRFSRKPEVDIRTLGFPARWHARGLLVVKVDLNSEEQASSLSSLCNSMVVIDRELQQLGKTYLDDNGLTALFEEAMPLRSSDAFQADFVDLAILHCLLEIAKPRQILELGSGLSTILLGNAARENAGQVICLEPNAEWAAHTTRCMPARLRANVSVRHTASSPARLGGRQTSAFEFQPNGIPDFIYLDGAPAGARFHGLETVMQMQDDLLPGTVICLDSRHRAMCALLGMTAHGTVEDDERTIKRPMDYFAQGVWIRIRNTANPVGPYFGLDRFCFSAALITA